MRKNMLGVKDSRVADSTYLDAQMLADGDNIASARELLRDIIEMSQGLIETRRHRARAVWTLMRWQIGTGNSDET